VVDGGKKVGVGVRKKSFAVVGVVVVVVVVCIRVRVAIWGRGMGHQDFDTRGRFSLVASFLSSSGWRRVAFFFLVAFGFALGSAQNHGEKSKASRGHISRGGKK
jgi:hypothetical protein